MIDERTQRLEAENSALKREITLQAVRQINLEAVARAAEKIPKHISSFTVSTIQDERDIEEFVEALAALKEKP